MKLCHNVPVAGMDDWKVVEKVAVGPWLLRSGSFNFFLILYQPICLHLDSPMERNWCHWHSNKNHEDVYPNLATSTCCYYYAISKAQQAAFKV